ncbi:MAG: ATP-binding protein [Elusimicrobia bacterium]|nr:ATP-binding protein [Elusimicrobiota bacterium]
MIKMPEVLTKDEQDIFSASLPLYFNPDSPIRVPELFAGRMEQITELLKVVFHAGGRHVIVYGERGVGKTSLVTILPKKATAAEKHIQHWMISCTSGDNFTSLWKNILSEIVTENEDGSQTTLAEQINDQTVTPYLIQQQLQSISQSSTIVLTFDEFDKVDDAETRRKFAETIKLLSDRGNQVVIILVGIADSVTELIGEHESVERNLSQVMMPRMNATEAKEILTTNGLNKLSKGGMGIEETAIERIIKISQGFPNYIHALGLNAGLAAVSALRRNVTSKDVDEALKKPIGQMHQTLLSAYDKATTSRKKRNLLREVLLACALAKTDMGGYFYPADVRGPFRKITKTPDYDIGNFLPTIKALTDKARGPALKKVGGAYSIRYRFNKVLLQPFVIMRGLVDGLITDQELGQMDEPRPT